MEKITLNKVRKIVCFVFILTLFFLSGPRQSLGREITFSSEQIETFARTQSKVRQIQRDAETKMAGAEPDARQEIIQEVNQKMANIIEAEDLSSDTYHQMLMAAWENSQLRQKIEAQAQEPLFD